MTFHANPALPHILPKEEWPGTPMNGAGRFFHPDFPFQLSLLDVLKWKTTPNPYSEKKKKDTWRAHVVKDDRFLKSKDDLFVWLGHASFFLRLNGLQILIDPVFGKISPITPRLSEMPVAPEKFTQLDYVLLTHDHRDHCDKPSLRLLAKNNPRAHFVTGLALAPLLNPWLSGQPVTEMGWFQRFENEAVGLKIYYLPTRHWGRRRLTDMNQRLWGAFVLQTPERTIYFGGDSGYGSHYHQTAKLFPNIDLAFLGIGAFAPEWFMKSNHASPADAFQAFRDLGAKRLVPMHYGTFDLSDEPIGEPERLIQEIAKQNGMERKVLIQAIGEVGNWEIRN